MDENLIQDLADRLGVAATELIAMFAKQWPSLVIPFAAWSFVALLCWLYTILKFREFVRAGGRDMDDEDQRQYQSDNGLGLFTLAGAVVCSVFSVGYLNALVKAFLSPEAWAIIRILEQLNRVGV